MTVDPDIRAIRRQRRQEGRCMACGERTPHAALCVSCRATLAYCPACEALYARRVRFAADRATEYCADCRAQQYRRKCAGLPAKPIVVRPPKPDCTVAGCGRPVDGCSPYCKKHRRRFERHGDPTITLMPRHSERPQLPPDPRLTIAEAAAVLGVSGRRVQILIDAGRFVAEKVGKRWRIERASIEAYAASRRTGRPRKN